VGWLWPSGDGHVVSTTKGGSSMVKQWALNQLRHARNSYLYTLAALQLLKSDAVYGLAGKLIVLKADEIIWNAIPADRVGKRLEFSLQDVVDDYTTRPADYEESIAVLYRFVRRNLVKESFEISKHYATETSTLAEFQATDWYHFARLIRNSISHNFHFSFTAADLNSRLPVTWRGVTIDASMDGKEITQNILGPMTTIELVEAMRKFVEDH
jgi:hypothetical protein